MFDIRLSEHTLHLRHTLVAKAEDGVIKSATATQCQDLPENSANNHSIVVVNLNNMLPLMSIAVGVMLSSSTGCSEIRIRVVPKMCRQRLAGDSLGDFKDLTVQLNAVRRNAVHAFDDVHEFSGLPKEEVEIMMWLYLSRFPAHRVCAIIFLLLKYSSNSKL